MEAKPLEEMKVVKKVIYEIAPENHHIIKPDVANRLIGVEDRHVKNLVASMISQGFDHTKPIIIGSDNIIKAGHNRFMAAGLAKVSIFVEVNDEINFIDQTKIDDLTRKWTTKDFIRVYAKQGLPPYISLHATTEAYSHFPLKIVIASAVGIANQASGDIFRAVRTGEFKYTTDKLSVERELDEIQTLHDLILDENQTQGQKISMQFGLAYLWIKTLDGFNKDTLIKSAKKNRALLVPQYGGSKPNRSQMLMIYNKGKHKKLVDLS